MRDSGVVPRKHLITAAVLVSAGWAAIPALAAPAEQGQQLAVFVPDSSVAAERFALAEKLQRASEWSKAAEVYQELLDQYRDRVVPAGNTPEEQGLYVSAADRAMRQLAAWPAEGWAAYNGRFQPTAEAMLQNASTASELRAVVDRYALTKAGQLAAGRLIQMLWDSGDLASAAELAERMGSLLPQDNGRKPLLIMQAGMAWHLSGNTGRAQELLVSLKRDFPNVKGLVAGQETQLATALQGAISATPPAQTPAGTWPSYGGLPDRSAIPDFKGRSDALLFSIDTAGGQRTSDPGIVTAAQFRMVLNQILAIQPVYDRRQLFFQDGTTLHAVSIDGGMKLPGWQSTSVSLSSQSPGGPMLRTLALTSDAIYAVLADSGSPVPGDGGAENSAVICVDRDTGKIAWRTTPGTLGQRSPVLKSVQFASPPLVVDDRLFVAARGGRNAQFNDIYVLCFDRRDGNLLWSSYVASGPNLNLMDEMTFLIEAGLPQLSMHAGRVIVTTNIGAIAAIEASDGTPAWLRTYPRVETQTNRMPGRFIRPGITANMPVARIFASSPAIISGGHVFALPVDGKALLVLDEVDGRIVKQIPRASVDNADTLVGVTGNNLVISGEHAAMALQWQKALDTADKQTDAITWAMDFPANAVRGRPFLTTDSLFVPTDDRLLRIATDKWKIEQTTPPYPSTWDVMQGPGNVLVTEEHVVVASAKRVNVYTNLESATARLDREVAASPNAVEPLVRYGELLFAAGQHGAALGKLQAGLELASRPGEQAGRDRLFSAALTCAVRLATQDTKAPQWRSFLELAKAAAASASQQVQYHFAAATMQLRANDGQASLAELQAVLDDPQQRNVTYRDVDQSTKSSAEIARRQISQLIDRYGSSVYQAVEQSAKDSLSKAQETRDSAALLELAQRFPNSSAAPLALYAAGQLQEQRGKLSDAASTLRLLVQSYPSNSETPSFVEALARVYAATPGKANIAARRLAQAAALYNNPSTRTPIKLPTGQVVQPGPFSDVADALKSAAGIERVEPLPDFHLPAMGKAAFGEPLDLKVSAERILPPLAGTTPNHDRAVVLSPGGDITIVDASGKPLTTIASPTVAGATDCIWIGPSSVLVKSPQEMLALDLDAGKAAWRVVPEQMPDVPEVAEKGEDDQADADEVLPPQIEVADQLLMQQQVRIRGAVVVNLPAPEPPPDGITDVCVVAGKVVLGTSSGRLAALDSKTGKLLWQVRPNSGAILRVSCSDDFTVAKVIAQGKSLLLCIDNDSGRVVYSRNFGRELVQNILVTDDGQLIYTLPNRIAAKDLFDQGERSIFETVLTDTTSFMGQDRPDQLVLVDDVILATAGRGAMVRMFSRFSGKQIGPAGEASSSPAAALPQQNRTSRTHLVPADPYVYAYNQQAIRAINVQRNESPERRLPSDAINLKTVIPGVKHLVAFDQPLRQADVPTVPQVSFYAFSRSAGASGESGRLDHMLTLKQPAGIASYQLLEGGLYLVTGDKRLLYYPIAK